MTTTTASEFIRNRSAFDPWGRDRNAIEQSKALAEKLNEEARSNWDREEWHRQVAADIASSLDYGFTWDNMFSTYIDVQNVGEFDRVVIRERRGLKVFYTARGGYIDESQLRTEQWELPRDTLGFHVSEFIDKLRANFATSIDDLVSLGQQKMEVEVNRRILSLVQTAVPPTSPFYVASTGLTADELNAAIREVKDNLQPSGGLGNVPVTIIGRAAMIDQISDFDGFADEAKEEIRLRGRLGTYRGAQVVALRNWADEDGVSFLPANELWVLGGTAGKFATYGGLIVKSWEENTVDYRHYRARKDIGGLINHPEMTRRIVDSSVTP